MICKKCGQEFPDDMSNCLWCGAPNEDFGKEPVPPDWGEEKDDDDPDALGGDQHPAGNFMWSAALGGPIFSTIVHYRKLKSLRFFLELALVNVAIKFLFRVLDNSIDWTEFPLLAPPAVIFSWVIHVCVMGKLGAWRIKAYIPKYNVNEYRRREKIGVILGLIFFIVMVTLEILFTLWKLQ